MSRGTAPAVSKGRKKSSSTIEDIFRQRILTGVWRPNDRLPSERQLAEELKVCAATVQRHLRELQNEGLICGMPGKGRYVAGVGQRPRTGNIGVVLFDSRHMFHPAMSDVVGSIGRVAAEAKRNLRIFVGNDLADGEVDAEKLPDVSNGHAGFLGSPSFMGVDGLIILTQRIDPEMIRTLAGTVPVVCSYHLAIPNVSSIAFDMAAGTFAAMRHVLDLGHRRIGLITKDSNDAFGRAARDGTRLAIAGAEASGVSVDLAIHTPADFVEAEGYRLGKEVLSQPDRPTAIICVDDALPVGVLKAADELGLRVPDDLSLIAWHDTLVARTPIGVTSVRFDRRDAGARMCRRLLEFIEHPQRQYEAEYVRPELVLRQSTAAPRTAVKG